jgi:hypothetical protein
MSCFATVSPIGPACSAKVSPTGPSCTMWAGRKHHSNSHSSEKDTPPIVFLISKQAAPYPKHGGTCCPRVFTPKIQSLVDLSTTCHDSINHLHHSDHCSNRSIDLHHGQLASQRMNDHNTLTNMQTKLNIIKDGRLVQHSRLHG